MEIAVNETRDLALSLDSQVNLGNLSGPQFLVCKIDRLDPFIF